MKNKRLILATLGVVVILAAGLAIQQTRLVLAARDAEIATLRLFIRAQHDEIKALANGENRPAFLASRTAP